jgi:hypothetical protein
MAESLLAQRAHLFFLSFEDSLTLKQHIRLAIESPDGFLYKKRLQNVRNIYTHPAGFLYFSLEEKRSRFVFNLPHQSLIYHYAAQEIESLYAYSGGAAR